MIKITTPFDKGQVQKLKAGDEVFITGTLYTSRDAGHLRIVNSIKNKEKLPFKIKESIIYYVGPAPSKPGEVIGSAGPTTSYRMDAYAPTLMDEGLTGMIGKGKRNKEVIHSMMKNKAIYFGAVGGAAALIANSIKQSKIIAYDDLGAEALRELKVVDFPAIVVIDCFGNNLYEINKKIYRTMQNI